MHPRSSVGSSTRPMARVRCGLKLALRPPVNVNTRPPPLLGAFDQAGPHRVEMNVFHPERSEGATIPTPAVAPSGPDGTTVAPEVTARALRRQFTPAYERRVLWRKRSNAALEESPLSCARKFQRVAAARNQGSCKSCPGACPWGCPWPRPRDSVLCRHGVNPRPRGGEEI
jgi:hypothetical protein